MKQVNLGIVGCGCISSIYFSNIVNKYKNINIYAIADLIPERVNAKSEEYGIERIMTFEQMLEDKNIDVILNITQPMYHYDISKRSLLAGKHVYSEKPLALRFCDGKELVELAEQKGLCIGNAPDTFMGSGLQTARFVIDSGLIGDVVGANAFFANHGPEKWHPDPEFFYKFGAGPLFDMGPYYVTALINLVSPIKSVSAVTAIGSPTRTITSKPHYGEIIDVEIPTQVHGIFRFENGAVGHLMTSFEAYVTKTPCIEIYGTKGTLIAPDPNGFGKEVYVKRYCDETTQQIPLLAEHRDNCRGLGLSDMADCILGNKSEFRANGKMALHVLEIMETIYKSSDARREMDLETTFKRPEPMPF